MLEQMGNPLGGDIIAVTGALQPLIHKFANESRQEEVSKDKFMEKMVEMLTGLVKSSMGWQEIRDNMTRYKSSTRILSAIDQVGFAFMDVDEACTEQNMSLSEQTNSLNIQLVMQPKTEEMEDMCFTFNGESICLPASVTESLDGRCVTTVASFLEFENMQSQLFPPFFIQPTSNQSHIVSLSVNNGSKITVEEGGEPVRLTFHHHEVSLASVPLVPGY